MEIRLHTTTTCRQLGNDTKYDTEKKNPTSHDVADTSAVSGRRVRKTRHHVVKTNCGRHLKRQHFQLSSKDDIVQDVFTKTSIDAFHDTLLQCNPYAMRGLQRIIPGRRSNVEVTPNVAGGTKVSMSIAAARKELKGQLKSPPEVPSLQDHTPPPPIFSLTLEIVCIAMGLAVLLLTLARSLLRW
jgi:hypothetical protein